LSCTKAALQPAAFEEAIPNKPESAHSHLHVFLIVQNNAGTGAGPNHEPVPAGQHLIVPERPHPFFPGQKELCTSILKQAGHFQLGEPVLGRELLFRADDAQDTLALFEIAFVSNPVELEEQVRLAAIQQSANLIGAPNEEPALFSLTIGILGGIKGALWRGHLPLNISQSLARHTLEQRVACGLPGVQIKPGKQGVIVEHLLEMGHQPSGIR
jgi:hypothetical protein